MRTLRDLNVSYLDLYLMHWPIALKKKKSARCEEYDGWEFDNGCCGETTVAETWVAMEELQKEGLVRSLGVSNFDVHKLRELMASPLMSTKPVANQVEMHPYLPQQHLVDFCVENGIQVVAYSPLGSPGNAATRYKGTGKGTGKGTPPKLIEHPTVVRVAGEAGRTPAQVLLRWALQRQVLSIPKSTTPSRIRENSQLWGWRLSDEQMAALNALGSAAGSSSSSSSAGGGGGYHVRYVPGNPKWFGADPEKGAGAQRRGSWGG
jgi:diketogulonate reductase-like aldo/keto reductase